MMKALLFSFALLSTCYLNAQDIDDFHWFGDDYEDQLFLSLGVNRIGISNNEAPNAEHHKQSGTTFKLDLKKVNFEKGRASYYYENKLLGDMVLYASDFFSGKETVYQKEESGLTSGFLGWVQALWNITEPDRYQIAVGASFKDFFLSSAYPEDPSRPYSNPGNIIIQEPNGGYYAIGPALAFRITLSKLFMAEYTGDLAIPFGKISTDNLRKVEGGYKHPYFMSHTVEVNSSKGFFVGYSYTSIMNRGNLPNNTKRTELFLGFRIPL
jgi:hypothetical protein